MEYLLKFGSISKASVARRLLSGKGVRARLTKTNSDASGCGWGLTVKEKDLMEAARILREAGISYERA